VEIGDFRRKRCSLGEDLEALELVRENPIKGAILSQF
jgi:hypothetical protein